MEVYEDRELLIKSTYRKRRFRDHFDSIESIRDLESEQIEQDLDVHDYLEQFDSIAAQSAVKNSLVLIK